MKIRLKGQYANSKASPASNGDSQPANGTDHEIANEAAGAAESGEGDGEGEEEDEEEEEEEEEEEDVEGEEEAEGEAVDDDDFAEGSTSQSSEASEEFLNEPINDLPESSGDEYTAPTTRPRGRPLGSKNKKQGRSARAAARENDEDGDDNTAAAASGSGRRPLRLSRIGINLAEKPISSSSNGTPSRTPTSSRRAAAAAPLSSSSSRNKNRANSSANGSAAAGPPVKRGRGRPPGSLNKKKGKARSVSLQPPDEDDSILDDDDNDETGNIDDEDEEEGNSTMQSGRSTPARVVYGADGRRRGGAVARTKAVRGSRFEVDNDELALPIDTNGEKKIDANGRLLGGREYKMVTFTSPSRPEPDRLYVLAIDAARCAGFRDSLYFFRRNPWLHKVNCSQEEKEMLIEMGRLHQNLRSRQVTIVTARNLYKVFGARFVKNGRYVIDDYYEAASIAQGHKPGEFAHSEIYDPEIDNTTLAMPKIGSFAKSKAEGRPAYMRMEKAFELLHRGMPQQEREDETPDVDNYATYEERERERNKKRKEEEGGSSEDEFGNRIVKKKRPSAFTTLALPQSYRPQDFGLITHPSYQSLVAGAQFGGNGQPPFGESWERSKARKPAPFLNGFNWMFEFARFTTRETNRAIMDIRKEWNGYHNITFGVPEQSLTAKEVEEEQEGVWDISDVEHEDEYETLDQFRHREGLDAAAVTGPDGEIDDRKRGRSPSPSHLVVNGVDTKPKPEDSMAEDKEGSEAEDEKLEKDQSISGKGRFMPKRRRRRRSPLRGYYDSHTRIPQVKLDTQPSQVIQWEQLDLLPRFDVQTGDRERVVSEASRKGVATVEYAMRAV